MDAAKIKLAGGAVLVVAAVGGGYAWARISEQPEIVEIGSIACGVPPLTASFSVPLEAVLAAVGDRPFAVGPVEVPQGGGPISLLFDPAADGRRREVRLIGDTLHLPTVFGQDEVPPKRITINCRDGGLGSVRYQGADRESATFGILRPTGAASTGGRPEHSGAIDLPSAGRIE
jgi:hypothetical protein